MAEKEENVIRFPPGAGEIAVEVFSPFGGMEGSAAGLAALKTLLRGLVDSPDNGAVKLIKALLQNAWDSLQYKYTILRQHFTEREVLEGYDFEIWLTVDLANLQLRCIDTGAGLRSEELKYAGVPGSTDKRRWEELTGRELVGWRGLGLPYVAFSTDWCRISDSHGDTLSSYRLTGGRSWVLSDSCLPAPLFRPSFEGEDEVFG